MRYIIPELINRHGLLYRLYTDSNRFSLIGRLASCMTKIGLSSKGMRRLLNRNPHIPKQILYSSDSLFFRTLLSEIIPSLNYWDRQQNSYYNGLSRTFTNWGYGEADCIYSMYIENLNFFVGGGNSSIMRVVDIYENPDNNLELIKEIVEIPEYNCLKSKIPYLQAKNRIRQNKIKVALKAADYYLCPSNHVINSISMKEGFDRKKVIRLPYMTSLIKKYDYHPVRHRIIWVGNDAVRKGLIYCAKAAEKLVETYPDLDFRIIGSIDKRLVCNKAFSMLNFIGILNQSDLENEYRNAEAFVFPTLSEGLAGVILEAAAFGCPVITTRSSGIDDPDFPAIIILERNVEQIISQVTRIFENSNYRDEISKRGYDFTLNKNGEYEKSLIGFLEKV